jgi:hypothetical protein
MLGGKYTKTYSTNNFLIFTIPRLMKTVIEETIIKQMFNIIINTPQNALRNLFLYEMVH